MTISTRLFGLIMTAALVGAAAADDLPLPGGESLNPPDLSLPLFDDGASSGGTAGSPAPNDGGMIDSQPMMEPGMMPLHDMDDYDGYAAGPDDWWGNQFAPIESTGTWLQRGFWYVEADGVVWNRLWNRSDRFMAAQDANVTNPQFFPRQPTLNPNPVFTTNRLLMLSSAQPGEDGSVRLTLGHFLFRDQRNRDHDLELTAFGGGDWGQHRVLSSENDFGLFVPFIISGNNRTFNASTTQEIDYGSHFSSFELNYHVKGRMKRDQLVMDPDGNWHRAATPGLSKEYLVGLRYMNLADTLDWRAQDIQQIGNDGSYFIRTDNDLFGCQMGAGGAFDASRFSIGLKAKGGMFVNNAQGRSTLNFTADDTDDADLHLTSDELSFISEVGITGKWHLSPSFSLRASYELMYVTGLALAPNQTTFITHYSFLNATADPVYHGASFGVEGYW